MKFKIMRNDFLRNLQKVQSISLPAERTSQNPILSHVKVTVTTDTLELFATNLEIGYKNRLEATVERTGSMTLDARKTFEIFRELPPEGEVTIDLGAKGWAEISAPGIVFKVPTFPGEDFPAAPAYSEGVFMRLEAGVLRKLIAKTEFAISHDDSMRTLAGALFKTSTDSVVMVATDGHRLAKAEKKVKVDGKPWEAIIPRRAIAEVKKLVDEQGEGEQLQLKKEGDHLILKSGSAIFYCRLVKGNFPDYEQVIPTEFGRTLSLDRERFAKALRRVSILSSERSRPVTLVLSRDKMELRSNSPEMGEAREILEIQLTGDEIEVGYNARYLMEALEAIEEEEVLFALTDGASASVLKGKANEEYISVVMPMRV